MPTGSVETPRLVSLAALCLCLATIGVQAKPPESTGKIKKVMLYNKVDDQIFSSQAKVQEVFSRLAAAKGFELVQVDDETVLTQDYLRQFQVMVWNNNSNPGGSVSSLSARQAVIDYLDHGGGWLVLTHTARFNNTPWPDFAGILGTRVSNWGNSDPADLVLDGSAKAHRELKWMLEGFPDVARLDDVWFSFTNTVRPLPGVTVVATARALEGNRTTLMPLEDESGDHTFIWAREVGKGRLLYNALGFGNTDIMAQQDSIVPKIYWENLRYAAGDFQNGCTEPESPGFDPAARVHIPAACAALGVLLHDAPTRVELGVSWGVLRLTLVSPGGPLKARLRDLSGTLIWDRTFPAGTREIALDGEVDSGVYHFEIAGVSGAIRRMVAFP